MHVADILEAIERIRRYVGDLPYSGFIRDEMLIDAVIRNLMIIGEAARNVPDEVKEAHPDIEWAKIVGLRNILIHAYSRVDTEIVWSIITTKLAELESQLKEWNHT